MTESPRVLIDSPCVCVATWREVFVAVWRQGGAVADLRAHYDAQRAFGLKLGSEKMITLSAVQTRAAVTLDASTRRALEDGTREMQPRVKAAAIVMTANGFAAAAVRNVIAALLLLNRPGYPTRVFDGEEAACAWTATHLAPDLGRPMTAADVLAAYRAVASPG